MGRYLWCQLVGMPWYASMQDKVSFGMHRICFGMHQIEPKIYLEPNHTNTKKGKYDARGRGCREGQGHNQMELGVREKKLSESIGGGHEKDVIKCAKALGIMILCLKGNTKTEIGVRGLGMERTC